MREALRLLEADGLVENVSWRGAVVRARRDGDRGEAGTWRTILEMAAAVLAIRNADAEDRRQLDRLARLTRSGARQAGAGQARRMLAQAILAAAHNRYLVSLIRRLPVECNAATAPAGEDRCDVLFLADVILGRAGDADA